MSKRLLHTPEGVRDIYGEEYSKKVKIQSLIHEKMKQYGYEDIQTPTFEFFDVFSKEIGTASTQSCFAALSARFCAIFVENRVSWCKVETFNLSLLPFNIPSTWNELSCEKSSTTITSKSASLMERTGARLFFNLVSSFLTV